MMIKLCLCDYDDDDDDGDMSVCVQRMGEDVHFANDRLTAVLQRSKARQSRQCLP